MACIGLIVVFYQRYGSLLNYNTTVIRDNVVKLKLGD